MPIFLSPGDLYLLSMFVPHSPRFPIPNYMTRSRPSLKYSSPSFFLNTITPTSPISPSSPVAYFPRKQEEGRELKEGLGRCLKTCCERVVHRVNGSREPWGQYCVGVNTCVCVCVYSILRISCVHLHNTRCTQEPLETCHSFRVLCESPAGGHRSNHKQKLTITWREFKNNDCTTDASENNSCIHSDSFVLATWENVCYYYYKILMIGMVIITHPYCCSFIGGSQRIIRGYV